MYCTKAWTLFHPGEIFWIEIRRVAIWGLGDKSPYFDEKFFNLLGFLRKKHENPRPFFSYVISDYFQIGLGKIIVEYSRL